MEPRHAGEVIKGADSDDDSLMCELDEARPGKILVSVGEDGEFAGGIYVDPADARVFGQALIFFADNSDYWIDVDE